MSEMGVTCLHESLGVHLYSIAISVTKRYQPQLLTRASMQVARFIRDHASRRNQTQEPGCEIGCNNGLGPYYSALM